MSFSFEFHAKSPAEATKILEGYHAPECVKTFITSAMDGFGERTPVYVKATGHLDRGAWTSFAQIDVRPISFIDPPKPKDELPDALGR